MRQKQRLCVIHALMFQRHVKVIAELEEALLRVRCHGTANVASDAHLANLLMEFKQSRTRSRLVYELPVNSVPPNDVKLPTTATNLP